MKQKRSDKHRDSLWRPLSSLLIVLALLATLPQVGSARKKWKPPTHEEVAQVWIGWSTDDLYLLRLDLFSNGQGIGSFIFLSEAPRTFRIASWKYEAGQIEVYPAPVKGPPTWVGPLRGSIVGLAMKLTATGRDWKLSFLLRREAELEEKWRQLKLGMAND